jgi:hypothetical protein
MPNGILHSKIVDRIEACAVRQAVSDGRKGRNKSKKPEAIRFYPQIAWIIAGKMRSLQNV